MMKRILILCFLLCYRGESFGDCSIVPKELPSPKENLFSLADDVKLGQELLAQSPSNWMDKERGRKAEVFEDAEVNSYLNGLVTKLLAHAPGYAKEFDYRFILVSSEPFEEAVMQALPGGIVLVSPRTLLDAPSDDYLAGILAHEIAHIALRHTARTLTMKRLLEIEKDFLTTSPSNNKEQIVGETRLLMNEFIKRQSMSDDEERKDNEFDADVWGARVAHATGFSLTSLIVRSTLKASFEANTYSDGSRALPNAIRTMILSCENSFVEHAESESDELALIKTHIRKTTEK